MKVSAMVEAFSKEHESTPVVRLEDVKLTSEGLVFKHHDPLFWDQQAIKIVGTFLGIKPRYLESCPPDLQQAQVNYWLGVHGQEEAMLHLVGNDLRNIHSPEQKIIPAKRMAEALSNAFSPDDEVIRAEYDYDRLHIDILSQANSISVPSNGTPLRPDNDITHGGIRLLATPTQSKVPVLQTYLHRLICKNGLTKDEPELSMTLRGRTVPELLDELESKAQELMAHMPERLDAYRASADVIIENDLRQFVYNAGRERNLSSKVMDAVMGRVNELPENTTAYDVSQIFGEIANEGIRYGHQLTLQNIAGNLSINTSEMLHRCLSCAKTL